MSAVAGIVDRDGGMRVVVTQRWRMRHHVSKGERLFVLPDQVEEPVPWDEIPALISKVQTHVVEKINPVNHCGGCNACCKVPFINDPKLRKPSNSMCPNCKKEFGCKIYFARPSACRVFECLWLKSQSRNDVMVPELRPDRCGVMFSDDSGGDSEVFEVHPDRERQGAVNSAVVMAFIDREQAHGRKAKLITYYFGEST